MDISYAWRPRYKICKMKVSGPIFRMCSFLLTSVLFTTMVFGALLYDWTGYNGSAMDLFFWDCFGPLILYSYAVFTAVWWAGINDYYISPSERRLLFRFMEVTFPKKSDRAKLSDETRYTHISAPIKRSAFLFAHRKKFFNLVSASHQLTSWRALRSIKSVCWIIVCCLMMFVAQNVENFIEHEPPAYVAATEDQSTMKRVFCVTSYVATLSLLFSFLWMWETMFLRLSDYKENVQCLCNLLVMDNKTESMDLSNLENVSAWLELQRFLERKGMILFRRIEPAMLSLWLMSLVSAGGFVYCLYNGRGLRGIGVISNNSLWVCAFFALMTVLESARMVYMGVKFTGLTQRIDASMKSQLVAINGNYMNMFIGSKRIMTNRERLALIAAQNLSQNMDHSNIIPNLFERVRFDNLLATAIRSFLLSSAPTIGLAIYDRLREDMNSQ